MLELQPVILAGGEGSKMYPLTEGQSKCLLPVANIPIISYVVNYLEKYGFQDFLVIVQSEYAAEILSTLQTYSHKSSKFELIMLPDEEDDVGTAEALALLKDKVETDLLVVSSDMLTDAPLHRLVDTHRMYDSSLTTMFANRVEVHPEKETTKSSKNKTKDPNTGCRDIVSMESTENRLLYFTNEGDLEQEHFVIKKSLLKKYPNLKLQTDLVDCHLFIMKKWLHTYLCANINRFESLKSDFLPHVVTKQFSKQKKVSAIIEDSMYIDEKEDKNQIIDKKDIFSYTEKDELIEYCKEWSGYQYHCLKEPIKCHAYLTDDFCLRVNTLPSYAYINRQIEKLQTTISPTLKQPLLHKSVATNPDAQIGKDCLIGESTTIGGKTNQSTTDIQINNDNSTDKKTKKYVKSIIIKKSSIGRHCKIGANVRITNCILMNHVIVGDGCVLQGSIICDNTTILSSSTLSNCQVSTGQTIKENSTLENESVVQEEMEFEDDDDVSE